MANTHPLKDEKYAYAAQFGRRLDNAIREQEMTQASAAVALGVQPSRISEYVSGKVLPPISTIDRMVKILELNPKILFPEWFKGYEK